MKYEDIPAVRWSHLKAMRISPLAYQHAVTTDGGDSKVMRIGSAAHCLALEPDKFDAQFSVWSGIRRGKGWLAFEEKHGDTTILNDTEYTTAWQIADAVRSHPVASQIVGRGDVEVPMRWTDPRTGIECKARADQISDGRIVELKTTAAFEPARFAAHVARMGYHGQLAFYNDGATECGMHEITRLPTMITVQSSPPYDVIVYEVPEHVVGAGRMLYQRLLDQLAECRSRNAFGGIAPDAPLELVLPEWAYTMDDDDDLELTVGGTRMVL